jgi:plasmid maintenance system killer protein
MKQTYFLIFFLAVFFGCQNTQNDQSNSSSQSSKVNEVSGPNADSEPAAIKIADEVMEAMGGLDNWNNTQFITWSFFGRRKHTWDKKTGNIRIEVPSDSMIYLMNVKNMTGKIRKGTEEITHPDSLQKYLAQGKSMWINDSYWLVMPFKLKDPGVTLKYLGEMANQAGRMSDVLELTFKKVGDTPDNKYHVMVDKETRLVNEWSFFSHWSDTEPRFIMPWQDYKEYGNILLSGDRGKAYLSAIAVYENLPGKIFNEFDK